MNPSLPVIQGQYFHDLMAQPQAVAATLESLTRGGAWRRVESLVSRQDWRRVVLTGMGASYHALQPLHLALLGSGRSSVLIETSELIHYGMAMCDPQTLLVVVSQSGGSAETTRLLDLNRGAPLLAVTNTPGSPLARQADVALLTAAGVEFSVSCKTYSAALVALQWLAALLSAHAESEVTRRLESAPALLHAYLSAWPDHLQSLIPRLAGMRHLFLAGRGASLAAVGTGALIIKEAARFHAEGMSSAALRHGPLEMLQADMLSVVLSGDQHTRDLNRGLLHTLTTQGRRCDELGCGAPNVALRLPDCDPLLMPLLEIAPIQMMTLALAALTGREAGCFEHASKITDVE